MKTLIGGLILLNLLLTSAITADHRRRNIAAIKNLKPLPCAGNVKLCAKFDLARVAHVKSIALVPTENSDSNMSTFGRKSTEVKIWYAKSDSTEGPWTQLNRHETINLGQNSIMIGIDCDVRQLLLKFSERIKTNITIFEASESLQEYPFVRLIDNGSGNFSKEMLHIMDGEKKFHTSWTMQHHANELEFSLVDYSDSNYTLKEIHIELIEKCTDKIRSFFSVEVHQENGGKVVELSGFKSHSHHDEQICRLEIPSVYSEMSRYTLKIVRPNKYISVNIEAVRFMVSEIPVLLKHLTVKSASPAMKGHEVSNVIDGKGTTNYIALGSDQPSAPTEIEFELDDTHIVRYVKITISDDTDNAMDALKDFSIMTRRNSTWKPQNYFQRSDTSKTQIFSIDSTADFIKFQMNRGIKPFLVQSFEFFVQPPQSMCLKVPRCNALQTKRCLQKEGSLTRRCVCGEGFKNKKSDPWSRQTCELANPCGIKSKSCNYGGICKDNTDGQEVDCGCPDGYSGHLCEHLPELCRNFPCGHGYCRISNGIPFCICFKGYKKSQGKECDIEVENYCKIEKGDYTLNVTSFKVNAIANLTCNPGTQLGGKDKRVTSKLMSCVEHSNIHGKVEQKWPTCYRSQNYCNFLSSSPGIKVYESERTKRLHETIDVSCEPGYIFADKWASQKNPIKLLCATNTTENGSWVSSKKDKSIVHGEPHCELDAGYCTLKTLPNMVASEKKAKFGGMITVSCTFGNEMLSKGETKYSTSLKCQNDGKFAPEAPLCTPIEDYCVSKRGNLPGVMSVEPIEVKPNTVITYSCAEGFLIEDTNSTLKKQHATRLCRPKSRKRGTLVDEFKGGEPLCERDNNYCSIIGGNNTHFSPQDGTGLNESVFIECDEGFEFGKNHTSMTLTCSKNGQNPVQPLKCEEKLCYIDESLNIEFGLIGEEMPDQCGEIVLPGKPCTAYCRKGYGINPVIGVEINISTSVSCEKGELQQDVKCTPLPCRELKIENAICSDPNCSMPTCGASQHNAECFFECNENFVQTNGKPAVCHLGLWINETECKDKTCDAIEESGIAQNNCAGTKHGNRCSVKCESGYRLASKIPQKMNALCHHGNWLDLPRCISKALYQPFPDTEVFHGGEISPLADADYITEIAAKNDSAIAFSGKFNSSGYHRLDLDYFDTTDDSYTVIDATKLPLNKEIYLPQVLNESVHLTFWLNVSIGQASHSMLSVNRKNESGDEIAAGNMNNVFMMTDDNHKHIKPECLNLICIDLRAFEISPSTGVQHLDYESAKKVPNHCCGCEMAIQIVLNEIPDDVFSAQVVSRGSSVTLYSKKYEKITLAHPFPVVMTKKVVCQHFLKPEKIVFQPPSIENIIGNVEVRYRGELYVKNGDQTNVAEYVLEQDKA